MRVLEYLGELGAPLSEDVHRTVYKAEVEGGVGYIIHINNNTDELHGGAHFHRKTTEVFTVMQGGGRLSFCQVTRDGEPLSEVHEQWFTTSRKLIIPPLLAHRFSLFQGTVLVYGPSPALPKDQVYPQSDTYKVPWMQEATQRTVTHNENAKD